MCKSLVLNEVYRLPNIRIGKEKKRNLNGKETPAEIKILSVINIASDNESIKNNKEIYIKK